MGDVIRREDLETAVEARRELGPEYEDEVLTTFLVRVEQRLAELGTTREQSEQALKRRRDHQKEMILGAMGISIPLLAIAAAFAGLAGIAFIAAALAVIAVVVSRST